ncbi:MAG: ribosome assembly RNA-binding protein YhbY [Lachnospiraceae bacterium]|nr:ribosome assembly RNA-binding protein YhbY [Lachnospiraceae bacterium]
MKLNSKQRAYLKSLAASEDAIIQIGKAGISPEVTASIDEALSARELIKISVLKNCMDDPNEIASVISERTHSSTVQVIGKKIVLYRPKKDKPKIKLPL